MRAVVQRVSRARVVVDEREISSMGAGLLVLVGVGLEDNAKSVEEMARKLLHLRVFPDEEGRMNRSLVDVGATLGLVSQFTLFGDARKGRRPSYGDAAAPEQAAPLFEALVERARAQGAEVVTGAFGAHMQVELVNDGPITLLIDTDRRF